MKRIFLLLLGLIMLTGCESGGEKLKIYAASSIKEPLLEVIKSYNEENPIEIVLNTGGSDAMASSISGSQSCDIFIPASLKQTDELIDNEIIDEENVFPYLDNRVVLVKNIDTKSKVTGFENANQSKSIAIAKTGVPIGDYAREVLINTGNLEDILRNIKVKEYASDAEVVDAIVKNEAEIGVVYATDVALHTDTIQAISEPPKDTLNTPVTYPVALINSKSPHASDFIDYLSKAKTAEIFEKYGFSINDNVEIDYSERVNNDETEAPEKDGQN